MLRFAGLLRPQARMASNFTMVAAKSSALNKNKEIDRPISPHLSIYKPQITMVLSIMHRGTGIAATAGLYGLGIGAIVLSDVTFVEFLNGVKEVVPQPLIVVAKTGLGFSVLYHTLNGVRHLVWDAGYGFQLKHLYMSGYIVVALTAIGTAYMFVKA